MDGNAEHIITRRASHTPSLVNQACFCLTGSLAGACTLPIDYSYQKSPSSVARLLRTTGAVPIYRAGFRFWTFTHVKEQLSSPSLAFPKWTVGALGGAAGGFAEICAQSVLQHRMPQPWVLGSQSLKLFLCFGTYTFLSTNLSEELPPKPFWRCWTMGAIAGGVGSGIVAALEGVRGRTLWMGVVPRGAVTIGTVISVQVTSCAALLKFAME